MGDEAHTAILLPSPPRDLLPMFVQQVLPYLAGRTGKTICSRTLHIFGMGESQLEDLLREQMLSYTNPTIAPYAKEGEVQLRVTAMAESQAAARALTDPVVDALCARLGDVVYGVDVGSLEQALVQALRSRGERVAVAESCSGGLLAKRLTDVPGASEVFDCGVVSYANAVKHRLLGVREDTLAAFGAVSPQTAAEMAAGVRKLAGADYGLSTTGIAGPGGGSEAKPVGLVYVGLATPDGVETLELHLRRGYQTDRSIIRRDAASHALAALRRWVRGAEQRFGGPAGGTRSDG